MTTPALPFSRHRNLWREEVMATLALAWPMVLTNLGQVAMTATNVVLLGRLGPDAIAASSLGTSLYFLPSLFGLGLMIATSPLLASELGRNRFAVRETRRTVRQGLWLAAIIALPIWLLLWNAERLFLAMGQAPQLAADAGTYVRGLMWAVLPFHAYLVLRSFISTLERPRWALVVVAVAVVVNALMNWLLIFGNLGFPAMGLRGSGLATTIASLMMFASLALVVAWRRPFARYHIFGRFWRADWPRLLALVRLGLPIAALVAFEASIFNLSAFLMGLIGTTPLAAHAIAIQITSIGFMVPLGLSQAVTVRVGLAYGAGNRAGVTRAGWTSFGLGVAFMSMTALTMILAPKLLIGVFLDTSDPVNAEVVLLAIGFLAIAGLFQVVDGAQAVAGGMLRGLHDTAVPMLFAAIGYWGIGLPLGALLAFYFDFGGIGIWIGLLAGLSVVAALLLLRWARRDSFRPMPGVVEPETELVPVRL